MQLRQTSPSKRWVFDRQGGVMLLFETTMNMQRMSRVTLKPGLPPKTPELKKFEAALDGLNKFYWAYVCSLDLAMDTASRHGKVADFVPTENWTRIDITCDEFRSLRTEVELLARHSVLVQIISHFEVYLSSVLKAYLTKKLKRDKSYGIKLKLSDVPVGDASTFLQNVVVESEVRSIVDAKYSERAKRIQALLEEHGTKQNIDLTMPDDALLVAANETRHCIVHCAGVADARAVSSLQAVFPGLKIGDRLPLDEATLWKILSSVRDGARAVDVALRLKRKKR